MCDKWRDFVVVTAGGEKKPKQKRFVCHLVSETKVQRKKLQTVGDGDSSTSRETMQTNSDLETPPDSAGKQR